MSTDQTAARDLAIEVVGAAWRASFDKPWDHQRNTISQLAVDALLAHPEVLRALAGAPDATRLTDVTAWDEKVKAVADAAELACAVVERVLDADASEGTPIWEWEDDEADAGVREVLAVADQLSAALDALVRTVDDEDAQPRPVDLGAMYATGTEASDRLVAESRALLARAREDGGIS